ncbi:hypothetical protein B4135_3283 [Caldibacillus debilis]|uniref:Uncharacterized protein n=1 Tax=Caldibacillus debilis TaxID=301148 RepID=A0A150LFR9_9BACI|nr:hypothetical protein B4135_3283 [Caldibacillus debilis]
MIIPYCIFFRALDRFMANRKIPCMADQPMGRSPAGTLCGN